MLQSPVHLSRGRYAARFAVNDADIAKVHELRRRVFRAGQATDRDRFDDICDHILVEDTATADLVCCFRMLSVSSGQEIGESYAAQFYDLERLSSFDDAMLEIGRFCVAPEAPDPDILRIAWGAVAAQVDAFGIKMLFGCSSFKGVSSAQHLDAFWRLNERHLAPPRWSPQKAAPETVDFAQALSGHEPNTAAGLRGLPPLLRSYLAMGGWVSDHAVIDRDLGTLHVFTGLELAAIPASRTRALRAIAGSGASNPR